MSEKGQTIAVKFKTRYEVSNSRYMIGVIGSISSLGYWNSEHCLCLQRVTGSRGSWEGTVNVPRNQPFEWKLVLMDRGTGKVLRWEERSNRRTIFKDGGLPEVVAPWGVGETVKYHDFCGNIMNLTRKITPQNDVYVDNRENLGYDQKPARAAIPKLTYDFNGDKRNRKAVTFPKPPVTDIIRYEKEEEKVNLTYPITAINGVERLRNKFDVFLGAKDENYIAGGGETSKQQAKAQTGESALAQDDDPSIYLRRRNSVEYQISRYRENQNNLSDLSEDSLKGSNNKAQSHNVIENRTDDKHDTLKLLFGKDSVNTEEKVDRESKLIPLCRIFEKRYILGTIATVLAVSVVACYRYLSL